MGDRTETNDIMYYTTLSPFHSNIRTTPPRSIKSDKPSYRTMLDTQKGINAQFEDEIETLKRVQMCWITEKNQNSHKDNNTSPKRVDRNSKNIIVNIQTTKGEIYLLRQCSTILVRNSRNNPQQSKRKDKTYNTTVLSSTPAWSDQQKKKEKQVHLQFYHYIPLGWKVKHQNMTNQQYHHPKPRKQIDVSDSWKQSSTFP